jgi:hypothetical protein
VAAGVSGDATVHLRLRGPGRSEEELAALRQQLSACLVSGVLDIRVHLDDQDDVELRALQALQAAGSHLRGIGGSLTVHGASRRVLDKLAVHGLVALLTAPSAVDAGADIAAPRAERG